MPQFTIRTTNSSLYTEGETEQPDAEAALAMGVRGAVMIAADEVFGGTKAVVVELQVEDADGAVVLRSAVSMSVAPLATGEQIRKAIPVGSNDR